MKYLHVAIAASPRPDQKQRPQHRWADVLYVVIVVVSIAGLAYIILKD
jgi:hypothetical protein